MKAYQTENIRNLALIGHSGSGKTNLTEAMLYLTGVTKRQGKVADKNTVSDFTKEEMERGTSISTTIIPIEWSDYKINIIDTPGYFDFVSEIYGALRAAEAALLVIDATSGVEVGTEKSWKYCEQIELPRIIFLNKIDDENLNFDRVLGEIKEMLGKKVIPFSIPIGEGAGFSGIADVIFQKGYRYENGTASPVELNDDLLKATEQLYEEIAEIVAESDEILMEKYFNGESFTREELLRGVTTALLEGRAVPLLVGSAEKSMGIDLLLNVIKNYMPAPNDPRAHLGFRYESGEERTVNVKEPFSAVVFKTLTDPFVGKLSIFKVISGSVKKGDEIYNSSKQSTEKMGGLMYLRGKTQTETQEVVAGDIGVFSKLQVTQTGDTLCEKEHRVVFKKTSLPEPTLSVAVEPLSKGDEEKIGQSLSKLNEEDPSFSVVRNPETKQLVISGQGNVQISVILDKLKNQFGVDVKQIPLRIAYRETIKGTSSVQGKHKKQSGGAGQYGDVHVRFEPTEEEFEFAEEVFGGAVPRNFFPAVEKGIRESLEKGILAGYPVVNVKATLFDGSYHSVDSNEMAFKIAGSLAFKKGMEEAKPILLEPIMKIEVNVPEDYMGDVMGDMNKRRGRILGMEPQSDGSQLIIAEAPHAELFEYAIDLRSMTQARGSFKMSFVRYEEVPSNIAEKIIEESKEDN